MAHTKTDIGLHAFSTRSGEIEARLRPAFILFDGNKSDEQILSITGRLGVTQRDIDDLVQKGFLSGQSNSEGIRVELEPPTSNREKSGSSTATSISEKVETTAAISPRSQQERYRDAKPLALMITDKLGYKAFRLNMAVDGTKNHDDLLALFPKIQEAAGERTCMALEWALKG
jgi:hypothetical protein